MRKIQNKNGFTFVEMLVCVITLLMVGAICATGTGISVKSYQQSRFESDSQMLESILDTGIGDLLRFASDVNVEGAENKVKTFTNRYYQMEQGRVTVEEGQFVVYKNPQVAAQKFVLIGKNAYAGDLYIGEFTLTYNEGTKLFEGSYTIKSKAMSDEKRCEFTYRTIAD